MLAVCLVAVLAGGCAARLPPPMPTVLAHPDFVYPAVPPVLAAQPGASRIDIGWRYLQADDLKNAELEFGVALKLGPSLYPARAGQGYVAMAAGNHAAAVTAFDAALEAQSSYVPALIGRGQALLALDRTEAALSAFERALVADPSLTDIQRRVELLRLRAFQEVVDAARSAAAAGRVDEARRGYERALVDSPDSPFLHRELGLLERRVGQRDRALERLRRAVELDESDAQSLVAIGELLEAGGDPVGAESVYRRAAAIDPGLNLTGRIAATTALAREALLPAQFHAALAAPQVTRGELATLVSVRLEGLLQRATPRQVVITDTQAHWAAEWIVSAATAGVMDPFDNHTFQPEAPVRRGDLAGVVDRLVTLVAAADRSVAARLADRPAIADVGNGHLQYGAIVASVASGVMPLVEGRFEVARPVSGQEAVEVISRVRALAAAMPGAAVP
jgi:tetratricopeptide (TPR) repeat protein